MKGVRSRILLCGYFVGTKMTLNEVKYSVRRMWGKHGPMKVFMNGNGFYMFKLRSEEGVQLMVENCQWIINNKPMIVQVWNPELDIEKKEPEVLPIWVKGMNMPTEG